MIWDLIQQWQISDANSAADEAKNATVELQTENRSMLLRMTALEESLERLSLATRAMAEILRDKLGVTQEQIEAKIEQIGSRDGKLDGRLRASSIACPDCHHLNVSQRQKCLYCGNPLS